MFERKCANSGGTGGIEAQGVFTIYILYLMRICGATIWSHSYSTIRKWERSDKRIEFARQFSVTAQIFNNGERRNVAQNLAGCHVIVIQNSHAHK